MDFNTALEALKTKYAPLGLGDKILTGFATKIAKTATEETLAQLVEDIEPELQIWQSVLDNHRKEISDLRKQIKPVETKKEKPKQESKEDEPEPKKDDTPEWAKSLMAEVQGLKTEKVQNSRKSIYEGLFKDVKDEKFKANQLSKFDRLSFKDDEDFNSFIESETSDIKHFNQSQANEAMGSNPPMQGFSGKSKPSEAEVNEIVDNMKF